jgi:hypothetical protein
MQEMQELLDLRLLQEKEILDKKTQNIFVCGFLAGIFFCFTGTVGFFTGMLTGIALKNITSEMTHTVFQDTVSKVKSLMQSSSIWSKSHKKKI